MGTEKDFGRKQDMLFDKRFSSGNKSRASDSGVCKMGAGSYKINAASSLRGPL